MADLLYDDDDLHVGSNYCRHGSFIGNPYGGDYLCGWCESGEEPPTQKELDEATIARETKAYDGLISRFAARGVSRQTVLSVLAWCEDTLTGDAERAWDRLYGEAA